MTAPANTAELLDDSMTLIEHLRAGASDLHPYCVDEVDVPMINCALPAYLNEAADALEEAKATIERQAEEIAGLRKGLTGALWYVKDHDESQRNDETSALLALIAGLLA